MQFRPCIDIHNGKVKQIVGGSLFDGSDAAKENYVSDNGAAYYANLYQNLKIRGGHIIILNPVTSPYYEATKKEAVEALEAYPNGLQIGGGITRENASFYLDKGASHVIVTSYVFKDGGINYENLVKINKEVGGRHLVLDLSCRKKDDDYYIVTDRWQKFSDVKMNLQIIEELSSYCDEFLIHAVDVEGKANGIETDIVKILSPWEGNAITYAGGIRNYEDISLIKRIGNDRINVTIGSALDIFGGNMKLQKVLSAVNG